MSDKVATPSLAAGAPTSLVGSCGRSVAFAVRLVVLSIVFVLLKAFFTIVRR